jgi:hypothetical protein
MLLFAVLTYGLVFLLADARLFGCDAKLWLMASDPRRDCQDIGILKWRQRLLGRPFFEDLLGCYFCTGCWAGPVAHWLLVFGMGPRYPLYCDVSPPGIAVIMTIIAVPLGGVCAFFLDTVVLRLEKSLQ